MTAPRTAPPPTSPVRTAMSVTTSRASVAATPSNKSSIDAPQAPPASPTYVTEGELEARLQPFRNSLPLAISSPVFTSPSPVYSPPISSTPASGGVFNNIALTNRIDQLTGTKLTNITVSGVSGLTPSDITTGITASNYLPLTGGTLSGDLTLTGNFTVAGAQSLSGAISIPYLNATSTSATSAFAGNVAINGTASSTNLLALYATTTSLFVK